MRIDSMISWSSSTNRMRLLFGPDFSCGADFGSAADDLAAALAMSAGNPSWCDANPEPSDVFSIARLGLSSTVNFHRADHAKLYTMGIALSPATQANVK